MSARDNAEKLMNILEAGVELNGGHDLYRHGNVHKTCHIINVLFIIYVLVCECILQHTAGNREHQTSIML